MFLNLIGIIKPMKQSIFLGLFFLLTAFALPKTIAADFERVDYPNNKFGIHLAVPSYEDLESARDLVNSSGGDWGYVTLVIEENDRNKEKWQAIFDQMRKLHLIPIVRLATSPKEDYWRQPMPTEASEWADFLNSLNWVVKNQYVVLFNEPNHGAEWGQAVDPQGYGQVALAFAKALKEKNSDFFIMMAGLDTAAPSIPPQYENEEKFLRKMFSSSSNNLAGLFHYLDGWASHSYPNPGFIGLPTARGKNSVKNYQWELALLKRLGVEKDLPVFITEAGWPHSEGKTLGATFYSAQEVAEFFRIYFETIANDSQVITATPFVLNYQMSPFDHFSWQKLDSKEFYPQYQVIQTIPKQKGSPDQKQKLRIVSILPPKLIENSTYRIAVKIKNEGQVIWSAEENYQMTLENAPEDGEYFFSDLPLFPPFEEKIVRLHLKTGEKLGQNQLSLAVSKEGKIISNQIPWNLKIVPKMTMELDVSLFLTHLFFSFSKPPLGPHRRG